MRVESPELKRCCFCLPLRRGLIGWGYARLALDILVANYMIFVITLVYPRYLGLDEVAILIVSTVLFFVDGAFSLLLVVAGHLKNAKLLRISLIYCTVWLVLDTAFSVYQAIFQINRIFKMWQTLPHSYLISELVLSVAVKFIEMFVQVYILLLIRSEEVKLRNQSLEMEFVNNATESEARCVGAGHDRHTAIGNCSRTVNKQDIAPNTDGEHGIEQYTGNQNDVERYGHNSVQRNMINEYETM